MLAGAFAHGLYLVYPLQFTYLVCVTMLSDSEFLLLIDHVVNGDWFRPQKGFERGISLRKEHVSVLISLNLIIL